MMSHKTKTGAKSILVGLTLVIPLVAQVPAAFGAMPPWCDPSDHRPTYLGECLHYAAIYGDVSAAKKYLDAGADIEFEADGKTPLLTATENGQAEVLAVLLARGAYVNARVKNLYQNSALHLLARECYRFSDRGVRVAKLLLVSPGVDVNPIGGHGTPLCQLYKFDGETVCPVYVNMLKAAGGTGC